MAQVKLKFLGPARTLTVGKTVHKQGDEVSIDEGVAKILMGHGTRFAAVNKTGAKTVKRNSPKQTGKTQSPAPPSGTQPAEGPA